MVRDEWTEKDDNEDPDRTGSRREGVPSPALRVGRGQTGADAWATENVVQNNRKLQRGSEVEIPPKNLDPVNTKSLAKDGGLEEMLKEIEGIGATDDPLLTLGTTKSPLHRLDNDPQVFLGASSPVQEVRSHF